MYTWHDSLRSVAVVMCPVFYDQGESIQVLQVMANMKAVIEAAGGSFDNVVKTTVLLADMGDFAAVNEVYGATSACCASPHHCDLLVECSFPVLPTRLKELSTPS